MNDYPVSDEMRKKVSLLTSLGAGLEYYDLSIFVFFAVVIGKLYFHTNSSKIALIAGYTIFAISTVARLFGGMFFSYIGDKYGRKLTFIYTIFFMTIPSLLIAMLPTYFQIGLAAPILLLLLRLLQGMAAGGEIPAAISFIAEFYQDKGKATACAFLLASLFGGFLLASLVEISLSHFLRPDQFLIMGWRIAFIIGGLFGAIAYIIRQRLQESPEFLKLQQQKKLASNPIVTTLKDYLPNVIFGLLLLSAFVTFTFVFFNYLSIYLANIFKYNTKQIAYANCLGIIVCIVSIVVCGKFCEYIDKKKILLVGCLIFITITYPLFYYFSFMSIFSLYTGFIILGTFGGVLLAPIFAILAELFPTSVRISGIAMSLNLSTILFGTFAADIGLLLIKLTNNNLSPAYLLIGCCLISLFGLSCIKKLQLF